MALPEVSVHKNACFVHRLASPKNSVHKNACFVHQLVLPEAVTAIAPVASVKNPAKIVTRDSYQSFFAELLLASVKNCGKIDTRDAVDRFCRGFLDDKSLHSLTSDRFQ